MRIKGDISQTTARAMSDIKKLLVKHLGESYNNTGAVIDYCVSCTVQSLNEHYAKQAKDLANLKGEVDDKVQVERDDKVQVEGGTPADVQDSAVDGSGPQVDTGSSDSGKVDETSSSGSVD